MLLFWQSTMIRFAKIRSQNILEDFTSDIRIGIFWLNMYFKLFIWSLPYWNEILVHGKRLGRIEKRNTDWFIWFDTFQAWKENHLWRVTASKSQGREIVFVPKSSLFFSPNILAHTWSYRKFRDRFKFTVSLL